MMQTISLNNEQAIEDLQAYIFAYATLVSNAGLAQKYRIGRVFFIIHAGVVSVNKIWREIWVGVVGTDEIIIFQYIRE